MIVHSKLGFTHLKDGQTIRPPFPIVIFLHILKNFSARVLCLLATCSSSSSISWKAEKTETTRFWSCSNASSILLSYRSCGSLSVFLKKVQCQEMLQFTFISLCSSLSGLFEPAPFWTDFLRTHLQVNTSSKKTHLAFKFIPTTASSPWFLSALPLDVEISEA